MCEGDTVWHTAAVLGDALAGKVLNRCVIRVPRDGTVDLTGETVHGVVSHGKHLFIRVGPASIHLRMQMRDSWRVRRTPIRVDPRVRIFLQAGDIRAACIDTGVMEVLDRDRDTDVVAHLGPDLLGGHWDRQVAAANLMADPGRPLAEALLDQTVLAGIGNVYGSELCFVIGHLPTTPVGVLSDPLWLVSRAREMLWTNRLRWTRCTTGDMRVGRELWVYRRYGQPCRRCRTPIGSTSGDRIIYWCPSCQR